METQMQAPESSPLQLAPLGQRILELLRSYPSLKAQPLRRMAYRMQEEYESRMDSLQGLELTFDQARELAWDEVVVQPLLDLENPEQENPDPNEE